MHRRQLLRAGSAAAAVGLLGVGAVHSASTPSRMPARFVSNPDLPTLLPASRWPGTPVDARGRFMNHEFPFVQSPLAVAKWMLKRNPQRAEKQADFYHRPVRQTDEFLHGTEDVVVWLGHASFFIRLSGLSLLIDPVLGKLPYGKRLSALPLDPTILTGPDYILVSHAHYDHCDKPSLRQLHAQNPQAQLLTSLGMDALHEHVAFVLGQGAKIWNTSWPPGEVVSIGSCSEIRCSCRRLRSSTTSIRCLVERPSRSSRLVTRMDQQIARGPVG